MTDARPAAAYFDFDRTVIDGDAGVLFGREVLGLHRRRVRDDRRGTLGWAWRNLRHETRIASQYARILPLTALNEVRLVKRSRVIRLAYHLMAGLDAAELAGLAKDFFNEVVAERIHPQARNAMERHRNEGRRVVIASTGMHLIIDGARAHLPVDDVIAVALKIHDGKLTGEVEGPLWGEEKAAAIRDHAHRNQLSLPRSYAYSDHHSDLHFLQLVGHPVAVNATRRLRTYASQHHWPMETWNR